MLSGQLYINADFGSRGAGRIGLHVSGDHTLPVGLFQGLYLH